MLSFSPSSLSIPLTLSRTHLLLGSVRQRLSRLLHAVHLDHPREEALAGRQAGRGRGRQGGEIWQE